MKKIDVLVIGSGPAGNTAAIYTARAGFSTAIATGAQVGGQLTITTDVENFPGFAEPINGGELMNNILKQSENLGVEMIYDTILHIDASKRPFVCSTEGGDTIEAQNIVIATGASSKWIGLQSEKEYIGFGVSGCATCDGNFFRNKVIAIVGGGDTAGTEAIHMSSIASKVFLIHRADSFPRMRKTLLEKIEKTENIEVLFNTEVVEVIGTTAPKKVTALKLQNNTSNSTSTIDVSAMFVAIGRKPISEIFRDTGIEIDAGGYIITAPDSSRTNVAGIYAVGDVANKPFKQAIVAAGYGCVAALEIQDDMSK